MSSLSIKLRKLRKEKNYSQQQVANQTGIHKSSINMYERGEREPCLDTLNLLAAFYGVDVGYLASCQSENVAINDRIKILRKSRDMSQQELAEKVGFKTASAINKIELGLRGVSQNKIALFADALGVFPDFLTSTYDYINDPEGRMAPHENKIFTITKEKEQKDMAKKEKELVFDKKLFADNRNIRVRIDDDCVDIVNDIWLQTGLSATKIVSEMIRFASQHVVLRTPMCFADDEE